MDIRTEWLGKPFNSCRGTLLKSQRGSPSRVGRKVQGTWTSVQGLLASDFRQSHNSVPKVTGRFGTYLYFCILGIQRVWMFPRRALGGATAITGVPKSTGTGSVSLIGEIGAHVIPHGAAGQGCKHATLAGSPCRESHFGGYPLGGKQCLLRATAWHKNSHLPLWWLVDLLVSNCTFHVPPWRPTEQVSLCVCFRCKTSLISRQYFTITTTCDPIE